MNYATAHHGFIWMAIVEMLMVLYSVLSYLNDIYLQATAIGAFDTHTFAQWKSWL